MDCGLLGHGGERNVFRANILDHSPLHTGSGKQLSLNLLRQNGCVAKESRRIEADDLEFHRKHLAAQLQAQRLARQFNEAVQKKGLNNCTKLRYLECFVCACAKEDGSRRYLFVEEYLEGGFRKWNSNSG